MQCPLVTLWDRYSIDHVLASIMESSKKLNEKQSEFLMHFAGVLEIEYMGKQLPNRQRDRQTDRDLDRKRGRERESQSSPFCLSPRSQQSILPVPAVPAVPASRSNGGS